MSVRLAAGSGHSPVTPINASALLVWRASCLLPEARTADLGLDNRFRLKFYYTKKNSRPIKLPAHVWSTKYR
jgi:hypothetical protein